MKFHSKILPILTLLLTVFASQALWAFGVGYSSYPMLSNKGIISTEFTGVTSNGAGVGLQGRYTYKWQSDIILDAGAGISSGDRSRSFFIGSDYELYPDFGNQPRVSIKGTLDYAEEFNSQKSILGIAPTVSKGFNAWGREVYPFVSLPLAINLNNDNQTYMTTANIALGAVGKLPFQDYQFLTANVEVMVNLKDSFNRVLMGISYSLN
jgi:hypothetical protein